LEVCRGKFVFEFGSKNLWIDRAPALSQAEIWLELSATAPPLLCCSARNGVAIRRAPALRDFTSPLSGGR
jgi:hypothetical protein